MMKALHSLWTEPMFSKEPFYMEDFEILTMVLSALTWKKYNGQIKMVADEKAIQYIENLNLLSIYDEKQYLTIDEKINPKTFWSAGKLFALQNQTEPYVVIDTDFIVWKNIDKLIDSDITVAYKESLKSTVYPDKENDVCSMVFAEQRMLGICASQWNMTVETLMNEDELDMQKSFTHIWGYKEVLKKNNLKRYEFCRRCSKRIKNDYPEIIEKLSSISQLTDYFE